MMYPLTYLSLFPPFPRTVKASVSGYHPQLLRGMAPLFATLAVTLALFVRFVDEVGQFGCQSPRVPLVTGQERLDL